MQNKKQQTLNIENSNFLIKTGQGEKWQKIGIKKRAGIVIPLFFVWSKKSGGIGEILDLKLVIDWCKNLGFSIIQLLPLNEVGFNTSPYSLQSGFALDPIYLSLFPFSEKKAKQLNLNFSKKTRINYRDLKKEKLKILFKFFLKNFQKDFEFEKFKSENEFWLEDFAIFRTLKELFKEKSWQEWPNELREKREKSIKKIKKIFAKKIEFQKWLQWQLFLQLKEVKKYAQEKNIFLKGDFPWLLSRDSCDVWAKREYFNLNFEVGAPPDEFSKVGQRWGVLPFRWEKIFESNFEYFRERLKYFENFYHLVRIDHIIGFFRIWKIPIGEPLKNQGKNGVFEPKEDKACEEQGRKILTNLVRNTQLLLCGEDLGTPPLSLSKVLKELGIPGISIQRWTKDWQKNRFLNPEEYPFLSVATLSTHDTSNFLDWFESQNETSKKEILKLFGIKNKCPQKELMAKALEFIHHTNSVFCINLILEWLFLSEFLKREPSFYRLNFPGKILKKNWSLKSPVPLEKIVEEKFNEKIRKILEKTKRI